MRVLLFSDAVFAIALTLVAVSIGVPAITGDPDDPHEFWVALGERVPPLIAFAFAFVWVAYFWRANHRFTTTLRAMDSTYITALLVYLLFIAGLPFPAATLGEHAGNPGAVAFFAAWAAVISALEAVLMLVAYRNDLYIHRPTATEMRGLLIRELNPVLAAAVLAVVCLTVSIVVGLVVFVLLALAMHFWARRLDHPGQA